MLVMQSAVYQRSVLTRSQLNEDVIKNVVSDKNGMKEVYAGCVEI